MRVKIITINNNYPEGVKLICGKYLKQINGPFNLSLQSIKPSIPHTQRCSDLIKAKETETSKLNNLIKIKETLVALDQRGKMITTEGLCGNFKMWMKNGNDICFIIGGANGLSDEIIDQADLILSLSHMTMAHSIAIMVLLEQIYRVKTLIQNHPYHRS
tara:strand:- start:18 stop:494 length:477 start_codon:yes stop_codon:yes gene_type:complete